MQVLSTNRAILPMIEARFIGKDESITREQSPSPTQSPTQSPSRCRSGSVTFSYEQTLAELDNLQKEFQRMEVNRRQKVNSMKVKRNQQLLTEYKIKIKDDHTKNVRQRRASLDNIKTREKINKSAKNQRKRESRLKLLETVGSNALKYGHLFSAQQKEIQKRRENVLQRRQELQRQKDQKRKDQYLQKQRQRDKQIARVRNKKRKTVRPKSASNSFLLHDDNKYDNKENRSFRSLSHSFTSFDEYYDKENVSYESEDISLVFDHKQKQNQRQMMRSKSARSLSLQCTSNEPVFKYNNNPSLPKKRKKKHYGFMKPTLSAYLITDNPSKLFAAC